MKKLRLPLTGKDKLKLLLILLIGLVLLAYTLMLFEDGITGVGKSNFDSKLEILKELTNGTK